MKFRFDFKGTYAVKTNEYIEYGMDDQRNVKIWRRGPWYPTSNRESLTQLNRKIRLKCKEGWQAILKNFKNMLNRSTKTIKVGDTGNISLPLVQ